jgi:nucleoside-diphosphate-sugar epimerase
MHPEARRIIGEAIGYFPRKELPSSTLLVWLREIHNGLRRSSFKAKTTKAKKTFVKILVTGATGFVGSAVVRELIDAGYQVLGLARSDAGAKLVTAAGGQVQRGDLQDLESLRHGTANVDAVIHTAFNHDFSKFAENCEIERRAIEALGAALEGSDRPLIVTNGLALLSPGRRVTEEDMPPSPNPTTYPRAAEAAAADLLDRGVRTSVVRLAASVHGDGDHAFVPRLIQIASKKGVSAYVGDGLNRWAAVHLLDAARLYRLVLEKGSAGARYHGVAEEGVPLKHIATVISQHLNVPVVSKSAEQAADHFSWFALFAGMDLPASSARTQTELGWRPIQPGLIGDLDHGRYFEAVDHAETLHR